MKVYCFGNEFLEQDSLAKELADEIKIDGIEFVKCNSPEEISEAEGTIIILDVVEGIDKAILIENLEQLKTQDMVSLHDFDLSFFLKLMKTMGRVTNVKIIGIPMKGDKEAIKKDVRRYIGELKV